MALQILQPYPKQNAIANQQAYIDYCMQQIRERNEGYIKAREYFDGIQNTKLIDRLKTFLGQGQEFNANYCPTVVNAKADRLKLTGFETSDDPEQAETFWQWWKKNKMDGKSNKVHLSTIRDADGFVLVEYDKDAKIPRFHHNLAGTEDGVMVYYSNENKDEIAFASKHWVTNLGPNVGAERRLNLYFPNRVERYISKDSVGSGAFQGAYMPYTDDEYSEIIDGAYGKAGVIWWTDTGSSDGKPLGIPIVHFKNNNAGDCYGIGQLSNVFPLQDALNKGLIDLLANMDAAGFGLYYGWGADWSGARVAPGAIVSVNKTKEQAGIDRIDGESPDGLIKAYNAIAMEIARVSGTPLSHFQISGQVAAEGTLKQQEITLIAQVEKAQTDFGNCWEEVFTIARRLHNVFKDKGEAEMNEDVLIDAIWKDAQIRNEKEMAEVAVMKQTLGVSQEQLWTEFGYDETQIAQFARAQLKKQAEDMQNQVKFFNQTQGAQQNARAQGMTQTENRANTNAKPPPM